MAAPSLNALNPESNTYWLICSALEHQMEIDAFEGTEVVFCLGNDKVFPLFRIKGRTLKRIKTGSPR